MHEWAQERDLKLDLLTAQRGSGREGGELGKRAAELFDGLNRCRPHHRPPARLAPQARGLLDQAGLGAVASDYFRFALGDLRKLVLKCFGNAGVKRASR